MSVDQKQAVEAEAQADVAATPVDATVQAETPAPAAETPETPVTVEPPVKAEPPKKRTTPPKAAKVAETPAPAVDAPAETPAPVLDVVQVHIPETPAPAPETPADEAPAADGPAPVQEQAAPVKPLENGFSWGSKRKEKKAQESADQSCEVEVTNTGAHSFETYTRTPLPTNQAVVITCESPRQRAAVVSKLNKLNQLAGVNRYITLVK